MAYSTKVSTKAQNHAGGLVDRYFSAISRGLFACSGTVERRIA
jgi:hypothetical protein